MTGGLELSAVTSTPCATQRCGQQAVPRGAWDRYIVAVIALVLLGILDPAEGRQLGADNGSHNEPVKGDTLCNLLPLEGGVPHPMHGASVPAPAQHTGNIISF